MVLGDHIWQAGAQKGVKKSRIDLSHYQRINQEELENIELMANRWVMENIPVTTEWMDRTEAEKNMDSHYIREELFLGKVSV